MTEHEWGLEGVGFVGVPEAVWVCGACGLRAHTGSPSVPPSPRINETDPCAALASVPSVEETERWCACGDEITDERDGKDATKCWICAAEETER